jgi:hypothetical protein
MNPDGPTSTAWIDETMSTFGTVLSFCLLIKDISYAAWPGDPRPFQSGAVEIMHLGPTRRPTPLEWYFYAFAWRRAV